MIDSLKEVNSLEVPHIMKAPGIVRMARIIGFENEASPLKTLADTARHLKAIGLETKILPTSTISFIEQQALAKLRRNPEIKKMYQQAFNKKPEIRTKLTKRLLNPSDPIVDHPTTAALGLVSDMDHRRNYARLRKENRNAIPV